MKAAWLPALALILLGACRLERPDSASQAAAILNKHPADFRDQLASLDALCLREWAALASQPGGSAPATAIAGDPEADASIPERSVLAESLFRYAQRLKPALAALGPEANSSVGLSDSVRSRLDSARNRLDSVRIGILNAFLFDTLGIRPDTVGADFAHSVPTLALQRRQGACVGLVLLYLALGRSLDLDLVPVFLPGHVFVRYRPHGGRPRNIETLRRGIARSDSFYRERFGLGKRPWYSLADARPEQALAALVFNLANAHRAAGDLPAATEEFRLVAADLPGFPEALGSLGACLLAAGDRAGARAKLLAAMAGDSLSVPARLNLAQLDK